MLFASTDLAARIEGALADLLVAFIDAIKSRHGTGEIFVEPIAGGIAAYVDEGSPFNKIFGLGFDGPVDEKQLEAIERAYAQRNAPVQVEMSCLANPSVGAMLSRRGYVLEGYQNALACPLPMTSKSQNNRGIEIRLCEEHEAAAWLDVMVTGFLEVDAQGVPSHEEFSREVLEHSIGGIIGTAGLKHYIASIDGQPVGGASVCMADGFAQLCGAATVPAYRRRGVQSALLERRLADASEFGCELALVDTLPGSKSQENAQRNGFSLLYTRAILVRHNYRRRQ